MPNFDTKTELGEYDDADMASKGIERRNLRTVVLATAVLGGLGYFWMRTTWGLVGMVRGMLS